MNPRSSIFFGQSGRGTISSRFIGRDRFSPKTSDRSNQIRRGSRWSCRWFCRNVRQNWCRSRCSYTAARNNAWSQHFPWGGRTRARNPAAYCPSRPGNRPCSRKHRAGLLPSNTRRGWRQVRRHRSIPRSRANWTFECVSTFRVFRNVMKCHVNRSTV